MTSGAPLRQVAELFHELGRDLVSADDVGHTLRLITERGLVLVAGAEHAGIIRARHGKFETVTATSDTVGRVDAIQYEVGHGPCVDAVLQHSEFRSGDLRTDPRWPVFGPRTVEETGIRSMVSFRMFFEEDTELSAALNFYATGLDAFTDRDTLVGLVLATHGTIARAGLRDRERAENLERALTSNREIGVAMGILMATHKLSREQAFDVLHIASQHTHRKIADLATDVADTGVLDLPTP